MPAIGDLVPDVLEERAYHIAVVQAIIHPAEFAFVGVCFP